MKKRMVNKIQGVIAVHESFNYDVTLLFSVLFLVGIGIVMVYSASSALALNKFGTDYFFLKKQMFAAMAGLAALIICRNIPLKFFRLSAYPLLFVAFFLLIAIQVSSYGLSVKGASRWLSFGSFTFQPSEFARFVMVIYLAYSMGKKQGKAMKDFYIGFLPHVMIMGVFTALILLQPDFGSAVILAAITWIMMFVGGVRIMHLFSSLLPLIPVVYYLLVSANYRMERITSFWDPWQYASNGGYQIIHSLMAFGTGGVWGAGIGQGYQKLFYLPEPHTDFIFSVIGEELGFVGVMFILILYVLILLRGLRIATNAKDSFASYLAAGITVAICLPVCVNMGVALALLPTKGLTLPFISYGGTSLLLNMASIGLLMNIAASGD